MFPEKTQIHLRKGDSMREKVKESGGKEICKVHISKFRAYVDQPFKVLFDESMNELAESIRENGVLSPIIARPMEDGMYEIIAGHRRIEACKLARVVKVPTIVRELDDDDAAIMLVDSNLQRERILPSEKARAYKLKLDALKNQGKRTDLTSSQFGTKFRSDELLAKKMKESRNQIHRYIRLTNLIDSLLALVDKKKIPLNAAVELSYLGTKAQANIFEIICRDEISVTLKQAVEMRARAVEGKLAVSEIEAILWERTATHGSITLKESLIRKYFPKEYSKEQIEKIVFGLLEQWFKVQNQRRMRKKERVG